MVVRSMLEKHGFEVVEDWTKSGFLVHERQPGEVTVRWSTFDLSSAQAELEKILPLVTAEFAGLICAGPMIKLFPKVGTPNFGELLVDKEYSPPDSYSLRMAAVREDVWQALLTCKIPHWFGEGFTINDYITFTTAIANEWEGLSAWGFAIPHKHTSNPVAQCLTRLYRGHIPPTASLLEHFARFWDMSSTEDEKRDFIRVVAEFCFIFEVQRSRNHMWIPSVYGGQELETNLHAEVMRVLGEVAHEWDLQVRE